MTGQASHAVRHAALWLLGLLGLAAAVASQNRLGALASSPPGDVPSWWHFFGIEAPVWLCWLALLPLIDAFRRRYRLIGDLTLVQRLRHLVLHGAFGLVVGAVSLSLVILFRIHIWFPRPHPADFWPAFEIAYRYGFAVRLLIYGTLVAVMEAFAGQREVARRSERESALQALLLEARLEGLRARLQPHFLFNTLNAISGLMTRDVARSRTALARLSDLLRAVLDDGDREISTLGRELEQLELYVNLVRLRFGDRLRAEIDVPQGLRHARLPSWILQPLVENSVVHGVEARREPVRIMIRAALSEGQLILTVSDDGPGLPETPREGGGMAITRARFEALIGDAGKIAWRRPSSGGCEVVIKLPLDLDAMTQRESDARISGG